MKVQKNNVNKMMKKIMAMTLLWSVIQVGAVFAQETTPAKTEEKPGMDVYVNFASSYFFRGAHVHSAATKEYDKTKGEYKDDVAFPIAPAIQPGFTFYTPLKGLSFDVWSSFALTNRPSAEVKEDGDTADGLRSVDEVDFLVSYEFDNKVGTWNIFFLTYMLPNSTETQYTELGFSYTAPVILSPTLYVANDVHYASTYLSLAVSHDVELAKGMTLTPGLTYAFSRTHGKAMYPEKGYMQFDLGFSMDVAGASISLSPGFIYQLDSDAKPSSQAFVNLGVSYSL